MFMRIWIFMICCLVATQQLLASDEETVFTLNEISVRVKPHHITEFDFQIDDDHCIMFMQNSGGSSLLIASKKKKSAGGKPMHHTQIFQRALPQTTIPYGVVTAISSCGKIFLQRAAL